MEYADHRNLAGKSQARVASHFPWDARYRNHREFEIIPEIWKAATEAHYEVAGTISPMQSTPDVGRMNEPEFENYLARSQLEEWQKDEIRQRRHHDRNSYLGDVLKWRRLNDTNRAVIAFNRALLTNSIFVHPDTFARFEAFATPMRLALNRFRVNMQMGDEYRFPKPGESDPVGEQVDYGGGRYDELARSFASDIGSMPRAKPSEHRLPIPALFCIKMTC